MATDYEAILRGREGQSALFQATIVDATGTGIPAADMSSLTATLVSLDDRDTNGDPVVINSRSNVNILNANGVTVSNVGVVTWTLGASDMAILSESRSLERHLLILTVGYNGGAATAKLKYLILVSNTEMT